MTRIAGIPHCVAYGPGELELAHQPDEYCRIEDLVNATKVLALATLDLMSRPGTRDGLKAVPYNRRALKHGAQRL